MRILNFFPISLLFVNLFVSASTDNPLKLQIMSGAEDYVRSQIVSQSDALEIKAKTLDGRIQVPHCDKPFSYRSTPESLRQSNVTVRATCPENNWYIYMMVQVSEMQDIVVLNTVIAPGTLLTEANTDVIRVDKKSLRTTTYTTKEEVIGARLKRRVRSGQPVTPRMLCYVCKGDSIVINASLGGLSIKTNGIAQQDGNLGDTIMVRNSHSKKVIDAKVTNSSEVSVNI
ncbi:flagellar basal body P-ring formation protein FlgA [Alteromonadaceae bacterium M269]|nr:flagellar basal body P-ring formation protein FlgA [Alteromonadaceae bacterium M269]